MNHLLTFEKHFSEQAARFVKDIWSKKYLDIVIPYWDAAAYQWREACQPETKENYWIYKNRTASDSNSFDALFLLVDQEYKKNGVMIKGSNLSWLTYRNASERSFNILETFSEGVPKLVSLGYHFILGSAFSAFTKEYWTQFFQKCGYEGKNIFQFSKYVYQFDSDSMLKENNKLQANCIFPSLMHEDDLPQIVELYKNKSKENRWNLSYPKERWLMELNYPLVSETFVVKKNDRVVGFLNWYYYKFIYEQAHLNGATLRFFSLSDLSTELQQDFIHSALVYLQNKNIHAVVVNSIPNEDMTPFTNAGFSTYGNYHNAFVINISKQFSIKDKADVGLFDMF